MSEQSTAANVDVDAEVDADARHDVPVPDDADNPWHGIPPELLDASRPYDPDTAGGCG